LQVVGRFSFVQAEDGIRDRIVTGVQTCALPIYEKYYFLRNNDGDLYISDNEDLRHDENYILEVDKNTDEIVEIRFDLKFEFDEVDESIFDEWYHNDIEQGREMLNEYLGIENYKEVSI